MSFKKRVEEHRTELNKSDRAIVEILLSNPAEAALWRSEDVAARAQVHPSAVTRTSKKLGYKGFLELRADLRDMHNDFIASAGEAVVEHVEVAHDGTVLGKLISNEIATIQEVSKTVEQSQLDLAADIIVNAHRAFVFGRGNATVLSELMGRRLRRFGAEVTDLGGKNQRDIAENLVRLSPDDVIIIFEFHKASKQLRQLLVHAAGVGCKLIVITDSLQILSPIPDVVLSASRGERDMFHSSTVPMMLLNAIILTMEDRYRDRVMKSAERLDNLLRALDM